MERSKLNFQQSLLLLFDLNKSAAETHQTLSVVYDDAAPPYPCCRFRFQWLKGGDVEDNEFRNLLDEKPSQIHKEFSNSLAFVDESTFPKH